MNINSKLVTNVSEPIYQAMNLEGTTKSPRKYTITEIAERVKLAFLVSPNEELESLVCEVVTDALRKANKIKKAKSDYNFAQSLLAYKVLSNVNENSLIASLYKNGKWSIQLTQEEHKEFCKFVNLPSESRKQYTMVKGEGENAPSCSFSPNFGSFKE